MASIALRKDVIVPDGGMLLSAVAEDAVLLSSLVASNPLRRGKLTVKCDSDVDGSLVVFTVTGLTRLDGDVDVGRLAILKTIPVTGGTLSEYTHNHVEKFVYCEFTPAATGTDPVIITAEFGSSGISI
jgi:hypothetical protein